VQTKFEWQNRPSAFVPQLYSWLGTSRRRQSASRKAKTEPLSVRANALTQQLQAARAANTPAAGTAQVETE